MGKSLRIVVQVVCYALFAALLGALATWPEYRYRPADVAIVKLSLSHAADRVKPCVTLTPQEVAELAPNMRQAQRCERERLPLTVELDIDGQTFVSLEAQPSGLWNDGPASVYRSFEVPPGAYTMTAKLRDTARSGGWDYSTTEQVLLEAGRYTTVTFAADIGGFVIR